MEEQNYSKRELDHFLKEIREILDKQNEMLARIETQVLKTNGRVSKLEFWRAVMGWGFSTCLALILFVLNYFK